MQQPGPGAYFSATISGTVNFDSTYPSWCVDTEYGMTPGLPYNAVVYTAGDTLPAGLIDKPQNLDLVNWVLNQGFIGQDAGGGQGNYTMCDVQQAIWALIDDGTGSSCGAFTTRASQIVALAEDHHGFVPGCGQYYLVVVGTYWRFPDGSSGTRQQTLIIILQNEPCPRYGRITVDKMTVPAGNPQSFNFNRSWGEDFALADLSDPYDSDWTLTPGSGFSVSEDLPPGWTLSSVSCVSSVTGGQVDPTNFSLAAGERVDCGFTNTYTPPGRIIVRKITLPVGAPAKSFEFAPSWGANFSLSNGGAADSGLLAAGIYSVAELGPPAEGWSPTQATCSDGSLPAAIGLSPQEVVTCTFVNTYQRTEDPKGSLTIVKVATPLLAADTTLFPFLGSLGDFSLADGGSRVFTELEAGAYSVSETQPTSANPDTVWEFEGIECTAQSFLVDEDNLSVTVNLAEGEAAVCTFYNREEKVMGPAGSLTIIKQTVPAGGTGFDFDGGSLGTFSLDDDGSVVFNELEAGAYTVAEDDPGGQWAFAQVECTALDWEQTGASVTVNLAEGEAAVCTFTNGQLPYTGSEPFMMVLLVAGLWALIMAMVMMVWPSKTGDPV